MMPMLRSACVPAHSGSARTRSPTPACIASLTPGLAAPLDADGFALADIAVADGKITAHRRRDDRRRRRLPSISPAASCCPASSTATRISTRAISGRASPIPTAPSWARSNAAGEDRVARWNAADVARRMDFSLRSRLRPRHQGAAHPSRQRRRRRRRSPGRCSRKCASAGAAASNCRRPACSASRPRATTAGSRRWRGASPRRKACSAPSPTWCPTSRNCSTASFALAIEHGLDLDFHADETDDVAAVSLKKIAEAALRHNFEGKILVGHCCSLARQPDREVLDTLDKVAQAGHRRRLAADVQPLSAGPPARRHHAALARRHAAARDEGARHSRRRRLRQHARSVLRLWRSRHAGSLPHGDAHPAFRPSGRRLAASGRRDARRNHAARGRRNTGRRAARPISSSSRAAAGPNCCRGPNRIASWCATAGRSSATLPDYAELDDLMV